jgi:signal transduction histidine kinase
VLRLPAPDAALQLTGSVENLAGALANLCLNAFDAGAGTVSVERTAAPHDQLALAVIDNGPGIAPALRARVFEPFVSGRPGGTGLGLAVARGIVERHGGELRLADSTTGCRFELSLPARAVRPVTAPVAA